MKILIIEDEQRIARRIQRMVTSFLGEQLESVCICDALPEGISYLENNEIDLLLLDLNLNGESGFDILELMVSRSFHTIIISAYTDQAIMAFAYGVLDFVPKPFDEARLIQAFLRIGGQRNPVMQGMNFLAVKKTGAIALIAVKDLLYIKGAGIYTELHLLNGKRELHDKSLEKLQQLLPDYFERIHKSYIVPVANMEQIFIDSGTRYSLRLKDGTVLPIGRSRYKDLKSKLI
ncbi:LytTR family DNA-binding domain-containing protein [Pedobacter sp. MC2016-24]|uniref:LytR/AlgR family response regulator transcription factor n=1 Tax=Pedobacter sp. MC2016-24 TaxID=2780090 RepID=UPI00187DFDEC|nr:LytTR family DNA-binding domain-containing protein [Pedobacter sp. MC2016-24]MBE9601242.1 response regulator transcription factor [Pedobacter sp. MC2016-24]